MEYSVNSWELLCHLYKNSEQLKSHLSILDQALQNIDNMPTLDSETFKKARYLNQLNSFLTLYDEGVQDNQILVSQELTTCLRNFSKLVDLSHLSDEIEQLMDS